MENKSLFNLFANTTPVVIVANENVEGNPIITPLTNQDGTPKTDLMGNDLGSIRLEQITTSLAGGSFLNARRRTAFIAGTMEQLTNLVNAHKIVAGSVLPGKIAVSESLEPFWPTQTGKINPTTDEPIGITVNGKFYPVYLRMTYTDDINVKDVYIRTPEDAVRWMTIRHVAAAEPAPAEAMLIPQA